MNKLPLIGIAGRAGAGKTTLGRHLVEHYGFRKTAFAEPLKRMLIESGLCTHDECYLQKTDWSRRIMQGVGTGIFRKQVHPLYWVNRTEEEICRLRDVADESVVVDDLRFPEEAQRISALGGIVIKVCRPDYRDPMGDAEHESERMVDSIFEDYIFAAKSGEIDVLIWQIDRLMERFGVGRRGATRGD